MSDGDRGADDPQGEAGGQGKNDAIRSIFDQPDGTDWFLANQIWFADAFNVEQGVTLNVGGVLVSGTLISGRTYFREIAETIRNATRGTHSEEFGQILGRNHEMFNEIFPERGEHDETYPQRPTSYIHLRDARIIGSNGYMIGNNAVLWRGKLSSVDGFSFGNLTIDQR